MLPEGLANYAHDQTRIEYSETHGKVSDFKPSMLVDLEAGRPMEVEGIIGNVVKKARELNINVPRYEFVLP